jgi:hypothetical protein
MPIPQILSDVELERQMNAILGPFAPNFDSAPVWQFRAAAAAGTLSSSVNAVSGEVASHPRPA